MEVSKTQKEGLDIRKTSKADVLCKIQFSKCKLWFSFISNLLQSMRLNYASLERIDTNMQFYPALIVCDLSHNRLTTLNPYGFEGQAQLNRLALGHNRIHTLYKESLNGLTNLQSLGEFSIFVLVQFD